MADLEWDDSPGPIMFRPMSDEERESEAYKVTFRSGSSTTIKVADSYLRSSTMIKVADSYLILRAPGGAEGITCRTCWRTSWNVNDVVQLYCGHCHKFHK